MTPTLFLHWLCLNNLLSHFLVIVGFWISQGVIWTLQEGYWLAALLGLCGQSIALIKGGPKHELKSTGPGSCEGVGSCSWSNVPTASSVWMHAGLWWAIEPGSSIPLCGRQMEYLWMSFFLTHDNRCEMASAPLTRTNPPEPWGNWRQHVMCLMSSLLQSHIAQMTWWTMSDLTVKTW